MENATTSNSTMQSIPVVGPAMKGLNPWQLQYYDLPTHDIIECTKQFSHCNTALINAFPLRANFNVKAVEYIEEVIMEWQARGLLISKDE